MARTKHTVLAAAGRGGPAKQKRLAGVKAGKVVMSGNAAGAESMAVKKAHRFRPGTVALREIRKYQRGSDPILRTRPFWRLVRERGELVRSSKGFQMADVRYRREVLDVAKEVVEAFLVTLLEDAHLLTLFRGVKGLQPKDIRMVFRMRHQTPHDWRMEDLVRE
jgi:histone H3